MGRLKDLTGQKFGRWTVIERSADKMSFDKKRGKEKPITMWLCRCECGTEKVLAGNTLRSGKSKQCMECAKATSKPKPISDDEVLEKISRKFARFEYIGGYTGSGGYLYLMCKDCGTIFRFNAQITRTSNKEPVICPNCNRIKREKEHQEKQSRKREMRELEKESKFIKKFDERYGHAFEYISGYKSNDLKSKIVIRCRGCGTVKERNRRNIFVDENISCNICDNNRKGIDIGVCKECGREYKKYSPLQILCKECHDKQEHEKQKERRKINKRLREAKAKKNGKIDYSITLTRLIERDNHICQLCGREVDETDYTYINDNFIAGNNYPSIDHIVPLSKGGKHQWDNVQLAHRICNSIKQDKENI